MNMGKYVVDDTMKFVFISPYDSKHVASVCKIAKSLVDIPIFVKLSANVSCIARDAIAAEKAGVDGIVECNTVGPGMVIDIETGIPRISSKEGFGGMSGSAIRPIVVRCVSDIAKSVKIPIIGVGGIMNGRDAIEYIMAGASAIQIGTAVIYGGVQVYKKICLEIEDFLKQKGYETISDIIGISQKYLDQRESYTDSLLHSKRQVD
jgi:dihydroorotate dehydrogenase (NAD+) catalytic subunit